MSKGLTKFDSRLKGGVKKIARGDGRPGFPKGEKEGPSVPSAEESSSMVFRHSPAGICITSPEGKFLQVNPAFCRFTGYTESELGRLSLEEIMLPDDMGWGHRSTDGPCGPWDTSGNSAEARFLRKDGSPAWGQVSQNGIPGEDGTASYVLTVVQDINEKKSSDTVKMEPSAKLAARVVELEASNQEMESFNYTVSHDLRSPLTSLGGFCELLLGLGKSHLDDQCKSIIRHMRGTVRHMDQLIETLLNFSKISNRELSREKVNLSLLAYRVAAQLRVRDPGRHVEFDIVEKAVVEGDGRLLREVLENLFDNAWKYTSKQENARIEFGNMEKDGSTIYFIRDNGPGFDMSQAERIFIPFQRLHSREEFAGYGIGLSTARRIIQRHGGRIWAEGEPGRGASFYFSIP